MMKAVKRYYLRSSAKLTSFIFEISICYVAKNRVKSAYFHCHTDITLKTTMVKASKNHQAYPTMGHFCLIAIPKEAQKIWWWPVVIYYGKISLIVDLAKMMIYPILTCSSMLYIEWHTFRFHWKFLFSLLSTDITQVTCQISDLNLNSSLRYWFLKRVS